MVLGSFWMLCGWGLGGLAFDRRKVQDYLAEGYPKDFWKGPRGRMSRQREAAPPGNDQSSVVRVQTA